MSWYNNQILEGMITYTAPHPTIRDTAVLYHPFWGSPFVLATFRALYRLCYTVCLLPLGLRVGRGYSAGCGITEPPDELFLSANSHSRGDVKFQRRRRTHGVCWCPGTTGRLGAMGVWLGIYVYDVYRLLFLQNIGNLKQGQALHCHSGGTYFESLS